MLALKHWHASVVDAAIMRAAKPYAAPPMLCTRSGSFRLALVGFPERVEYQQSAADAPKPPPPPAAARSAAAKTTAARAADAVGISAETLLRMVVQQVRVRGAACAWPCSARIA